MFSSWIHPHLNTILCPLFTIHLKLKKTQHMDFLAKYLKIRQLLKKLKENSIVTT